MKKPTTKQASTSTVPPIPKRRDNDPSGVRGEALRYLRRAIVHASALPAHQEVAMVDLGDEHRRHQIGLEHALGRALAALEISLRNEVTSNVR